MATIALRADRWQVHHLGTQVPIDDLVEFSAAVSADVVVLSVTTPAAAASGAAARTAMAGTNTRVLLGEPGLSLRDLLELARGPDL